MKKGNNGFAIIREAVQTYGKELSEKELNQIIDHMEAMRVNVMMGDEDIPQKPHRGETESKRAPKDQPNVANAPKPKNNTPKTAPAKVDKPKPKKGKVKIPGDGLYVTGDKIEAFIEEMWYPGKVSKDQQKGGLIFLVLANGDKKAWAPAKVRPIKKARRAK